MAELPEDEPLVKSAFLFKGKEKGEWGNEKIFFVPTILMVNISLLCILVTPIAASRQLALEI